MRRRRSAAAQTVLGPVAPEALGPTLMRRRGFSEAEIQAIVADNPRRLLTVS